MKNLSLIPVLALLFMVNVASMCSLDDDAFSNRSSNSFEDLKGAPLGINVDPAVVISTMTQGTWRVTLFQDSGITKTSNFAGYNFTFGANGNLSAANGTLINSGNWSVIDGNAGDDNPKGADIDFNISFVSPPRFADLTEDWSILELTNIKVRLVHKSGGKGGTDYLTFEKN